VLEGVEPLLPRCAHVEDIIAAGVLSSGVHVIIARPNYFDTLVFSYYIQ